MAAMVTRTVLALASLGKAAQILQAQASTALVTIAAIFTWILATNISQWKCSF
jgi:hypothetical protein